jgi:site-specific recombinase XerD
MLTSYDIRVVREIMGPGSVETTMIYFHVLKVGDGMRSSMSVLAAQ